MLTKVGTARITSGKKNRGKLQVGIYPDGRKAFMPVITVKGKKSGPTVALITGAHGNELNGPEIVYRFISQLDPDKLRGTIIVLPLMNPWGFRLRERYVAIDGRDLNRSFPGHLGGSFSLRVAHEIMRQVVSPSDLIIDVHDAGARRVLLPHAIAHLTPSRDPTRELALAFGFDAIVLRKAKPGMLARAARQKFNKPVVTLEIGGAMRFWEPFQQRAIAGLFNIFKKQGLLVGTRILPSVQLLLQRKHDNRAEMSGLIRSWVNIGDLITKGQPLYKIYNPLDGKTIIKRASYCGIIIARIVLAHVTKGEEGLSIVKFMSCKKNVFALEGQVVKNRAGSGVRMSNSILSQGHRAHPKAPSGVSLL